MQQTVHVGSAPFWQEQNLSKFGRKQRARIARNKFSRSTRLAPIVVLRKGVKISTTEAVMKSCQAFRSNKLSAGPCGAGAYRRHVVISPHHQLLLGHVFGFLEFDSTCRFDLRDLDVSCLRT